MFFVKDFVIENNVNFKINDDVFFFVVFKQKSLCFDIILIFVIVVNFDVNNKVNIRSNNNKFDSKFWQVNYRRRLIIAGSLARNQFFLRERKLAVRRRMCNLVKNRLFRRERKIVVRRRMFIRQRNNWINRNWNKTNVSNMLM